MDEGLRHEDVVAGTQRLTGEIPQGVAARDISGDSGQTRIRQTPEGKELATFFDRSLSPEKARRVVAHEFGHVIDELTLDIDAAGIKKELRRVYSDLNKPYRSGKAFGPEHGGYRGDDVDRELVAESIRAYLQDPNYIKTAAPKTAARLRAMVNADPRVNKTIQLNQLVPAAGALGLVGSQIYQDPTEI